MRGGEALAPGAGPLGRSTLEKSRALFDAAIAAGAGHSAGRPEEEAHCVEVSVQECHSPAFSDDVYCHERARASFLGAIVVEVGRESYVARSATR